jgi:lysyl-tRNA synthetase class II
MPSRRDAINEQRRLKLERLRARGIDPYPHRFEQKHTTRDAMKK